MAIIDGGVRTGGGPMRFVGSVGAVSITPIRQITTGAMFNRYVGDAGIPQTSGVPSGYLHPKTWSMPWKPGGLALRVFTEGETDLTIVGGVNGTLIIAGDGTVTLAAVGTATGTLVLGSVLSTSPDIQAIAHLEVAVAGQGTTSFVILGAVTGTLPLFAVLTPSYTAAGTATLDLSMGAAATATLTLAGAAQLSLSLSGTGAMSIDVIGALFLSLGISGVGTFSSDLSALATMEWDVAAALTANLQRGALGNLELHIAQSEGGIDASAVAEAVWSYPTALSLLDAVALVRQVTNNRLEVDLIGQRLVLYDDDGTTELRAWSLDTDQGENVTTVRGAQTKRGVPVEL